MWDGCIELLFRITVCDVEMDPAFHEMSLPEMIFRYHYEERDDEHIQLGPEQMHAFLLK